MENDLLYEKRMRSMLEKLTGAACYWDPLWEKNFCPCDNDDMFEVSLPDYLKDFYGTQAVTSFARAIQSVDDVEVLKLIDSIKNSLNPRKNAPGISDELLDPNSDLNYDDYKDGHKHLIYFGYLARTPEEYKQAALKLISNYWGPFYNNERDFFGLSKNK